MNPPKDIATFLQTAGVGTVGTDIFIGPVRPDGEYIPVKSVFILSTGGRASDRIHSNKNELRYPSVQIRVRDYTYDDGYERANNIHNVLEGARLPGYWDIRTQQSEPVYIEQDENGHYEWSINVEARYQV